MHRFVILGVVLALTLAGCGGDAVAAAVCPLVDRLQSGVESAVDAVDQRSESLEERREAILETLDDLETKVQSFVDAVGAVPELGSAADLKQRLLEKAASVQERIDATRASALTAPSLEDLPDLSSLDLTVADSALSC